MERRLPVYVGRFAEELLGLGRYSFTRKEAQRRFPGSPAALYAALYRQAEAGRLVMPRSGFYVIVDAQHRAAGTMPPEWFVHDLMKFLKTPYYVGLLSAAQVHGAAHHRPQEFQVVVPGRAMRPAEAGNARIRFFGKGRFDRSVTVEAKTPAGFMTVSSPETTAWDLIRYAGAAGGFDNAVTVLAELAESLKAARLLETAKRHGDPLVARRLGFVLDRLGHGGTARGLRHMVGDAAFRLLDPSETVAGAEEDPVWRLKVNNEVETEA